MRGEEIGGKEGRVEGEGDRGGKGRKRGRKCEREKERERETWSDIYVKKGSLPSTKISNRNRTDRFRSTNIRTCRRCSRSRRARTACCAGTRAPGTSRWVSCPSVGPRPSLRGSRA